jgi:uncharacterized membrane protein
MTQTVNHPTSYATADQGKVPAFIVYALYIAGVFSAHLISPIGVIVAYVVRADASPWVRTHLDHQVKMFWTVFWWMAGLITAGIIFSITVVGLVIGIPLFIAAAIAYLIFSIWFAVKSVIGMIRLSNGQPV